jgi:hypothetical protein
MHELPGVPDEKNEHGAEDAVAVRMRGVLPGRQGRSQGVRFSAGHVGGGGSTDAEHV